MCHSRAVIKKKNLKFTKSEITQAAWQQEILTFTAEGGLFLNTSQNSETATIKTDSPRPPKAIIWHLSSVLLTKQLFLTEDCHKSPPLRLSSVVSSPRPLISLWVFLLSVNSRDVFPSEAQTKWRRLHAVDNKSCHWVW